MCIRDRSAAYPQQIFSVGLRVNCDIAALCPNEVLVEEEGGRFGYCYENGKLKEVMHRLSALPNVKVAGLHLHSSTQSRTVEVYAALASMAVRIAEEYSLDLSYVDMGGGYFGGREDKQMCIRDSHHSKQGVEQCRPYIPIVLLFNKECYDKGGC